MMDAGTLAAPRRRTGTVWTILLLGGGLLLGRQIVVGGPMLRVVAAVVVIAVLAIPAMERPHTAVLGLFLILPFLGMIRHMFLSTTGPAFLDPLLLITSAVAIVIFVSLSLNDQIDFGGTPLSKVMFLLIALGLVQIFNPGNPDLNGGHNLLVGLTGVMINLIPMSFFFIGRSIADHQMTQHVIRIVMAIGAIVAAYGLFQVFVGFRGFEQQWLATNGFNATQVGSTTRPFSTFNNPGEYASYAHIAFTITFASLVFAPRGKRLLPLVLTCLVAYSGFLIGSRGFTVKVALAVIVLLAARAKNRLLAFGIVTILVSAAVLWSASTSSTSRIEEKQQGVSQLVEQQRRALADPFDRSKSTLPIHFDQFKEGITFAITKAPFGLGTGAATRGGAKFGGTIAGTEIDIGDVFLSLGIAGGALYLAAILLAIGQASRVRRALPGPVYVGIWAMATTSIGAWVIGGNYAVVPLIWFLIGASDGAYKRLRDRGLLPGSPAEA